MARFFSQTDIDLFKECFFYNVRRGHIKNNDELTLIMRSLSYSPTKTEVATYFEKYSKPEGQMDFASFLDAMHDHSQVENCKKELMSAFESHDSYKRGYVAGPEVKHILMNIGEGLSKQEVDTLFRDAHVQSHGQLPYTDFVQALLTPAPDY